ncbi:hypothetical protein GCM10022223_14960 [Kineosporia mesophila]|uniref:Acyl carrier protein n=1 Tax=Kineosporia mesophila TaxID=566012 RepID=A0ABP6ZAS0_9ACTN|nr:hypothetical protein [Kineosporia mesophila]MCD5352972.1 hypothetical protein [Kineosporia mesophila]
MSSESPDALVAWVNHRGRDLPEDGVTEDLPLLAGRHLTSLHIPELILLLERISGREVEVDRLQAGDFQDLRTIRAKFLAPAR